MIFKHTYAEPGMWRGWLRNGQSVEISTQKGGWHFGAGVHIHSNDEDLGDRMIFLKLWRLTVVLPLGIVGGRYEVGEEPQWSAYASSEFGLTFHFGKRRWQFDWPWSWHTLAYEELMADGTWRDVLWWARTLPFAARDSEPGPYTEVHPYTYTLRSGTVQHRTAEVSRRRHVLTWRAFKSLGWPRWIKESIDVRFDDEVGERTGSWKGGTIGCGYDLLPGETLEECLRRMEREMKFT